MNYIIMIMTQNGTIYENSNYKGVIERLKKIIPIHEK